MGTKIFVGGLDYGIDSSELREEFAGFGTITDCKVVIDRDTDQSRGFGFITFSDAATAQRAITRMDGEEIRGRRIRVSEAVEKPRTERRDGGGYSGGDRPRSDESRPRPDRYENEQSRRDTRGSDSGRGGVNPMRRKLAG